MSKVIDPFPEHEKMKRSCSNVSSASTLRSTTSSTASYECTPLPEHAKNQHNELKLTESKRKELKLRAIKGLSYIAKKFDADTDGWRFLSNDNGCILFSQKNCLRGEIELPCTVDYVMEHLANSKNNDTFKQLNRQIVPSILDSSFLANLNSRKKDASIANKSPSINLKWHSQIIDSDPTDFCFLEYIGAHFDLETNTKRGFMLWDSVDLPESASHLSNGRLSIKDKRTVLYNFAQKPEDPSKTRLTLLYYTRERSSRVTMKIVQKMLLKLKKCIVNKNLLSILTNGRQPRSGRILACRLCKASAVIGKTEKVDIPVVGRVKIRVCSSCVENVLGDKL